MEAAGAHAHKRPHAIRYREERLPLADSDDRFPGREGEEFVEPPHAAVGQRIAPPHPLPLKHLKRCRRPQAIPVVFHIEQVAADRAAGVDLVHRKRRPTGRRDALLESEIGASDDGQVRLLQSPSMSAEIWLPLKGSIHFPKGRSSSVARQAGRPTTIEPHFPVARRQNSAFSRSTAGPSLYHGLPV